MAGRFSVEAVFKAVDRMTQPVNRMQRKIGRFTKSMARGLKRVDRVTNKINKGLSKVGQMAKRAGLALLGLGVGLKLLNDASIRSEQLAKSVGFQVDSLEALAGAVRTAGFETDHVVDLIEEMNNKLGESAGLKPITPVSEALHILNLRFKDLKGLSPEEQFTRITDAALKMKDAQKAAAAMDMLMGGEANKIIGVLRQQGDSMADIIAKYARLNARTEESRKKARGFSAAWADAQFFITSMGQELAGLIGGVLTPFIRKWTDWAAANKALIRTKVVEWIQAIVDNFGQIVTWLKRIGVGLLVWFTFITVLKTFIAVMTAVNIVMAMNPIGLIVLGVMAAIAAISALVFWFDEIKAWFLGLPTWGKVAFMALLGPIGMLIGAASLIMDNWGAIKGFFMDIFTTVGNFFDDMVHHMTRRIEWIMSVVRKVAGSVRAVGRFFGVGDDEGGPQRAPAGPGGAQQGGQMVTPQERITRTMSENTQTQRNEVVIRDETGRAEQRGPARPGVLRLEPTGAF